MLSILLKGVAIYFIVLIVIRFMGKREIGQLSIFDFAILLVIADLLVVGMEDKDNPFYFYIFPIAALAIIQKLIAFIMLKVPALRIAFEGKDSLIIDDGKLNIKVMKKQNYNVDDLITQLRLKNIRSLSEVKYVILETNGEISVYKHSDFEKKQKGTDDKANIKSHQINILGSIGGSESKEKEKDNIYPFPLIVSGRIIRENLDTLQIEEKWLRKEVEKKGKTIKDIMFANYENGKLFIAETKDT